MSINFITPEEARSLTGGDPALLFGPGASTYPTLEEDLAAYLKVKAKINKASSNWMELADEIARAIPADQLDLKKEIEQFLKIPRQSSEMAEPIAKSSWSAVISLTLDLNLRSDIATTLDKEPTGWHLVTINEPTSSIPLNTLPYYSLMGDLREVAASRRVPSNGAEYLTRKRKWPRFLHGLGDIVKSNPVVCLGTSTIVDRVIDFFDALASLHPRCPTRFFFLETDACLQSARLLNLAEGLVEIYAVKSDHKQLLTHLSKQNREIHELPLFAFKGTADIAYNELRPVSDFAYAVPPSQLITPNPTERRKNLEALFRPASLDWSPFSLELNFPRDAEDALTAFIHEEWASIAEIYEVLGEAGCGKSVSLKSTAFKLANKGYFVLWLRRGYGELSGNNLGLLAPTISKCVRKNDIRTLIFIDDPVACGIDPDQVVGVMAGLNLQWKVISCRRKTDTIHKQLPDDRSSNRQFNFPEKFSEAEWEKLPAYLVKLGVAQNEEAAQRELGRIPQGSGRDVLCALWYLLPQTREVFFNSLSNEYFRLGGLEFTITKIAQAVSGSATKIVRKAYEYVTVCAGLGRIPVPTEVLVGALGITYAEWTAQCDNNKPVWGRLVEEFVASANTFVYRNRNEIVTQVLLRFINGPDGGFSGEYRILCELLSACDSAQPQYVEFIKWILVDRREQLEERFSLEQITELYDRAIRACPLRLGIVEHHRSIARSHLGADSLEVHKELTEILKKSNGERSDNDDSTENIHTSAAAALARAIKAGSVDPVSVTADIFWHIEKALGKGRINWHAYHTQANALIELANQTRSSSPSFSTKCSIQANQIAEKAITILDPLCISPSRHSNDRDFFRGIRNTLITSIADIPKAKTTAEQLLESGDQSAALLVLRTLASSAAESEKNSEFKKVDDYARLLCSRITNLGLEPLPAIVACRIENEFRWKMIKGSGTKYDFEACNGDIKAVLNSDNYSNDPTWIFMAGVISFLAKDYSNSDAYFMALRRASIDNDIRNAVRCKLLNSNGLPHVIEGRITDKNNPPRLLIYSADLQVDVLGYSSDFRGAPNSIVHFHLGFTMKGPIALPLA